MKNIRVIFLLFTLLAVCTTLGAKEKKKDVVTPTEDTYFGPISCTVPAFKVVAPKPGAPGSPGTQANPGDLTTLQTAGTIALPQLPQPAGLNALQPPVDAQQIGSTNNTAGQKPAVNAAQQQPAVGNATPGNGTAPPTTAPNGTPQNPLIPNPSPKKILNYTDCLANGGLVVILPDGQSKSIVIENPEVIRGHEWQRLSLSGYAKGNSFHVVSLRVI